MKRIVRSALVAHSAADLYALVDAIEDYPGFLPWCVAAQVTERTPDSTLATLQVGMGAVRQSFTTRNRNRPGESMEMTLVEGPFRSFSANWKFIALSEQACRVEFVLAYEFSSRLLGKVLEPLFDHIADTMVGAFVARADKIHGKGKAGHAG